jgi:hypothetical protein
VIPLTECKKQISEQIFVIISSWRVPSIQLLR